MDSVKIGLAGGEPLPILSGFPNRYQGRKFRNATCYHIKLGAGDFILFQHIQIGPHACWYTEYYAGRPRNLYSDMTSMGVEFHTVLEGAAMYNLEGRKSWYRESAGVHNILVNGPRYTRTALSVTPVKTFDIHVSPEHFGALTEQHPALAKLLPALRSGEIGTLFSGEQETALALRCRICQLLHRFEHPTPFTAEDEASLLQDIDGIIGSFADIQMRSAGPKIPYADVEMLTRTIDYINTHYMDSQVIAAAQQQYRLAPDKLIKYFKILFNKKPKEYLIAERVKHVKTFMQENPTATRQQIAMSVGYLDSRYLNKVFSKLEGQSVAQYLSSFSN